MSDQPQNAMSQTMEAFFAPPEPAQEVVTLLRSDVETILKALEDTGAIPEHARGLDLRLREPAVQLWAIHSVGPNETYPCASKEDAEKARQAIIDSCNSYFRDTEQLEHYVEPVVEVIPSPWEPAEHYRIMAEEKTEHYDALLAHYQVQTKLLQASTVNEPTEALWAVHNAETGISTPCESKEAAERQCRNRIAMDEAGKAPVVSVIPSPFKPGEHYKKLFEKEQASLESLIDAYTSAMASAWWPGDAAESAQ
ncbi:MULTISPECIES: hypothetical protein [Pseudomonas]|uniref:Uncharacterized protein n=1 Tax=Pseudomonas lutea TaxID=243924 RepID=A0A9X8MH60_9PSED|nr:MULTISPECIES: hypothetical protein [Pseudomonas]SER37015.1 hypothetical protein SAMN05216409_11877 [Pseudomonas lutea]